MNFFISSLKQKGNNEYKKYVKPLTIIRIEGELFLDARVQSVEK